MPENDSAPAQGEEPDREKLSNKQGKKNAMNKTQD